VFLLTSLVLLDDILSRELSNSGVAFISRNIRNLSLSFLQLLLSIILFGPLISNLLLGYFLLISFALFIEFLHQVTLFVLPSLSLSNSLLVKSSLLVGVHHSLEGIELHFHLSSLNSVFDDLILLELREAVGLGSSDALKDV
jgi:hypothetical protein